MIFPLQMRIEPLIWKLAIGHVNDRIDEWYYLRIGPFIFNWVIR